MNMDDFERQLERQPLRQIPTAWRAKILRSAETDSLRDPVEHGRRGRRRWQEWLWPCPQAWAGLAAVWIMILILNSTGDQTARVATREPSQRSSDLLIALRQQRRLLAELIEPAALTEPPRSFVPRPRSERPPESIAV